jgi:hypothetical protein
MRWSAGGADGISIAPALDTAAAVIILALPLATFRRKIEVLGCCGRIAQGMENCKDRRN